MARLQLAIGQQRAFLNQIIANGMRVRDIAKATQVCERTVRDWRREKHRMFYEAATKLAQATQIALPDGAMVLPEFWHVRRAASLGARRRLALHGPLGTRESRRKGGLAAARKFREHPEWARRIGWTRRKPIHAPRLGPELAEFIGIMLGDGCLGSRYQVSVYFDAETDREHATYIQGLIERLFGVKAVRSCRPGTRGGALVVSNRNLVEFLEVIGLRRGDKVQHQVDVPSWIWEQREYQVSCLRGLMDTDGSVYLYDHRVNGSQYRHLALSFSNRSQPLLASVRTILQTLGFAPTSRSYQVNLQRQLEIDLYFQSVGSHNPKFLRKVGMI
ncbi:MAG: hypothetical protein HY597_07070 [Candidatus Omnitrophica bacterium]|nr:hypothetical protein [Candidatus Omnitrophota bacterium]